MFNTLKNKFYSFLNKKQDLATTLHEKLGILKYTVEQIEEKTHTHYQEITTLASDILQVETDIKSSLQRNNKVEAEYMISELSLMRNSYTQKKKIYDALLKNLSDLKHTQLHLENKLQKFESEHEILNAKIIKEQSIVEVEQDIRELSELNEVEELKERLIEAECLTEAFEQINGEKPSVEGTDLEKFKNEIEEEKRIKEDRYLEKLSLQMGKKDAHKKNERIKDLLKDFESEKTHIQNRSKQELVQEWLYESKSKSSLEEYSSFFEDNSKDNIIDDFFND